MRLSLTWYCRHKNICIDIIHTRNEQKKKTKEIFNQLSNFMTLPSTRIHFAKDKLSQLDSVISIVAVGVLCK